MMLFKHLDKKKGLKKCQDTTKMIALNVRTNVPWSLRNRWNKCLDYCGKIIFRVSHVFCKGNTYACKLANLRFIHRGNFH